MEAWHIDLSISRLATYKALRDEIINYRARRTWAYPNAMQGDAVHVSAGQERQGGSGNAQPTRAQAVKGINGKGKKSSKSKDKDDKPAELLQVEGRVQEDVG